MTLTKLTSRATTRARERARRPRACGRAVKALLGCVVALVAIGAGAVSTGARQRPTPPQALKGLFPVPPGRGAQPRARPNIVFVLTDDLSMNLLRFMPHVLAME